MTRWYVPAYEADNGRIHPCDPNMQTVVKEHAEHSLENFKDWPYEVFVAVMDQPQWQRLE